MQMSLAINGYGYICCNLCRTNINEKEKYVLVDGSEYHVDCFTHKVGCFMELLKELGNE